MSTDPRQARQAPPWQTILSGYGMPDRGQVPPDQIRVSDAERQQMADQLARHFAEGRLDQSEHDERLSRAMGAKTRGDFRGLLDDLPPAAPFGGGGAPAPVPPPARPRTHRLLLICAVVCIAAAAGAAFSAPWHFPWVLFLILAFLLLRGPLRYRRHHHHHYGPHTHAGPWDGGTY